MNGNFQEESLQNRTQASQHRTAVTSTDTSGLLLDLQDDLDAATRQLEVQAAGGIGNGSTDVDSWATRINRVQADLERSKATARGVVQQAEGHKALDTTVVDWSRKVDLLEKELQFNEALEATLGHIQSFYRRLDGARNLAFSEKAVSANAALKEISEELRASTRSLPSNVVHALESRAKNISDELAHTARTHLLKSYKVTVDPPSVDVSLKDTKQGEASLSDSVSILSDLDALEEPITLIKENLEEAFFSRWSSKNDISKQVLKVEGHKILSEQASSDSSLSDILGQVSMLIKFTAESLPEQASRLLSAAIMPKFLDQLETERLNPSVPLGTDTLSDLDDLLSAVKGLDVEMEACSWDGASTLEEWISKVPTLWLARQREHVLEIMRQSLLSRLRERKEVERIETQTIEPQSTNRPATDDKEAAWDTEWNDGSKAVADDSPPDDGDDDASAWDTGDEQVNGEPDITVDVDSTEDAAWGWDGDDATNSAPIADENKAETPQVKAQEPQKLTLRETYTVTGVPGTVIEQCLAIFVQAQSLGNSNAKESPIGAGIPGLWNLPALSMALYRAMALTAYDKIDSGKLLLYNDASWMADQIRHLMNGSHEDALDVALTSSVRRKMEQEASAFIRTAKLAYGAEMESQRTILRDLLDGAQGFSNCTTSPFVDECDSAVSLTMDRLREVHRQWQPTLSRSALLQSIGSLLSVVISKFILDIEDLADIGEDESARLLSYCKSISSINDMFTEQSPDGSEVRDMTPLYCQNWLKLQYLGEILDGNLADIKYLWKEGELSIEFDADEVADLIRALFADSDHRRKAIAEISRGH